MDNFITPCKSKGSISFPNQETSAPTALDVSAVWGNFSLVSLLPFGLAAGGTCQLQTLLILRKEEHKWRNKEEQRKHLRKKIAICLGYTSTPSTDDVLPAQAELKKVVKMKKCVLEKHLHGPG